VQSDLHANGPQGLSDLVNGQALMMAYADATFATAIVALVCIPLVFLMRGAPATEPTAPAAVAA